MYTDLRRLAIIYSLNACILLVLYCSKEHDQKKDTQCTNDTNMRRKNISVHQSNAEEILNPVKLVYNKSYNNPNFVPREGVLHAQTIMFIHTKWVPRHISNKLSNYNALCTS